jgi:GAF domain-containing protein
VLATPLRAGDVTIGAVAVYGPDPSTIDQADMAGAELFGSIAGAILANLEAYEGAKRLSDQLSEALATRDVIGTAKGILMEREAVDEDAAFSLLRSASQRANRKLREVAETLVEKESSRGHTKS